MLNCIVLKIKKIKNLKLRLEINIGDFKAYLLIIKYNCMYTGDNESGKTTLIAKLQGVEDPKKGSGLEFAYIDVRDDYRDGRLLDKMKHCLISFLKICLSILNLI